MKSELTRRTDSSASLKVVLDKAALEPVRQQVFDKLRGRVKAAGFRPGKAPDHIIERELGDHTIHHEVIEAAVMRGYAQAVREHSLPVIAQPNVKLSKFVPYSELEFTAEVELLPPVKLPDYKTLKARPKAVKVEGKEVDRVIEDLRLRVAERHPADRPAQMGDEVTMDFTGSKNDQTIDGATGRDQKLILGSGRFIPGFEEKLVGKHSGEEFEFDIDFPKDYQETSLAGARVKFKVILKAVHSIDLPPADDGLAQKVSQYQTLDEMRNDITSHLELEQQHGVDNRFEQELIDELLAKTEVGLPNGLVGEQVERLKHDLSNRLTSSGLDIDKYLGARNQTMDQLETELRPEAERRVKLAMVLSEVAKAEKISVTDQDVNDELTRLKSAYQERETQAELARPEMKEEVYNHLMATRTIAKIKEYILGPK
jgi:trigger factor